MSNLGPQQQNASYAGLLQVPGGVTSVLQNVTDGDGNPTGLSLSTTAVSITGLVSSTAQNIYGGSAGQIPFQTALSTTSFISNGTTGQFLKSNGASAPTFATITAGTVGALPITGGSLTGALSLSGYKITDLATPTVATDAATKDYVDSLASGLKPKTAATCASTGNIASLSGLLTIDGITVTAGQRVLIKNQTASADNGIYVAAVGAWARATDADTWSELVNAAIFVQSGSTNAATTWVTSIPSTGTLGVDPITFVQFSAAASYTAGTGLTLAGNQFSLTSPVAVALGGTNNTATPVAGTVAYGDGSKIAYTSAGTTGQFLKSNGSSAPGFVTVTASTIGACASSIKPSLSGTSVTGTVNRPVTDMFGDYLNIKDFGATGNAGDDATSAINAALALGAGTKIYFPPGTYQVTSTINISSNNVVLQGAGSGLTQIIDNFTTQDVITVSSSNVQIYGIQFVSYASRTAGITVDFQSTGNGRTISDFSMDGAFCGVRMNGNDIIANGSIRNSRVNGNCIVVGDVARGFNQVIDNVITDAPEAGPYPNSGLLLKSTNDIRVTSCEFQHNVSACIIDPTILAGQSLGIVYAAYFESCFFDSSTQYALYCAVGASSVANNVMFSGCWFGNTQRPSGSSLGAGGPGVFLNGPEIQGMHFDNCQFISNGLTSAGYGIIAANTDALVITDSRFEGNGGHNIYIYSGTSNFTITGNTAWSSNAGYGIYIGSNCDNYTITSNLVYANSSGGIYISSVSSNNSVCLNAGAQGKEYRGLGFSLPTNVAGSRSLGSTYQNTKPYPIMVCVTASANTAGVTDTLQGWVGSNIVVGQGSVGIGAVYGAAACISFIVPPGATYKIVAYYGYLTNIALWYEYD